MSFFCFFFCFFNLFSLLLYKPSILQNFKDLALKTGSVSEFVNLHGTGMCVPKRDLIKKEANTNCYKFKRDLAKNNPKYAQKLFLIKKEKKNCQQFFMKKSSKMIVNIRSSIIWCFNTLCLKNLGYP